jgi:hypothetical protein
LKFDARMNESRAAMQTFLLQCSDETMVQRKAKGRVAGCRRIFPNARFGFQMMSERRYVVGVASAEVGI